MSSWPWHFATISDAEKQQRRELLTLRGNYAQLSIIVAILLFRCYTTFSPTYQRQGTARRLRQKQWLDAPFFMGWTETRRQYLTCLIWLIWLVSLSTWATGEDYLHLTKSFGHVGLSQLPLQVSMSPILYLTPATRASSLFSAVTGLEQVYVTAYHRLFARTVLGPLLVAHGFLYCNFFIQSSHPEFSSLLFKRIRDLDVQVGILGLGMIVALVLVSRPLGSSGGGLWTWTWNGTIKERRRAFFVVHLSLVGILCLAVFYHVRQAEIFVVESLVVAVLNWGCCYLTAK
ncbi:hypothetical protein BDV18DRAFT_870 [Aspergillus unguis]